MTQTYDMRRLHMGCGESLQHHLPLLVYGKRYQLISKRVAIGHHVGRAIGLGPRQRREKH